MRWLLIACFIALLVSGCSPSPPPVSNETPVQAASRLLPAALDSPAGAPYPAGTTMQEPVRYHVPPKQGVVTFDSLEPRDFYSVALIDPEGRPVGEFDMAGRDERGRLKLNGSSDESFGTLIHTEITRLRDELGDSAHFKVVGEYSGEWIAVSSGDDEWGVPVFNAFETKRVIGKRYPLAEMPR